MKQVTADNFGLIIAYLLPGFIALWGLRPHIPLLELWFEGPSVASPTVGGFLYVTLASIASGMTVSTIRWLILDWLHHQTGIPPPKWDFAKLQKNVAAFDVLINIHYRFYQHHGHMLIAVVIAYLSSRWSVPGWSYWYDAGIVVLLAVLYLASRDAMSLCGRPHKDIYVGELVMWPGAQPTFAGGGLLCMIHW